MHYILLLQLIFFACFTQKGCPVGYGNAKDKTRGQCIENACPIQEDVSLQQCAEACTNQTDCQSFNHTHIGQRNRCHLHNYIDDTVQVNSRRKNKLVNKTSRHGWGNPEIQRPGYTFCQKGK